MAHNLQLSGTLCFCRLLLHLTYLINVFHAFVYIFLSIAVEKKKEGGESTDRSQKKKIGLYKCI